MATTKKKATKKKATKKKATRRASRKKEAAAPPAKPAAKDPREITGPCPKSDRHTRTRVYKDLGHLLKCVCDDCGHDWQTVVSAAN